MLFNSPEFLLFFVVVFSAYWAMPWKLARTLLLLVASYYFYYRFNGWLALVVAISSCADYCIGIWLEDSRTQMDRKRLLVFSIVMNLGLLVYFKYANFFLDSLQQALALAGIHRPLPMLEVILPIGISFYTFEAISYTVDVYTGRAKAERDIFRFLLFITFFPRMVAGPIIRAKNFLPQLDRVKHFDWGRFDLGLQYVMMGFFKKLAVADRMAGLVDPVYANPGQYSTGAIWVAAVAYSLQIYGDFSGYSDIAIGTAHMLGFRLPRNFNMPYIARNISDFWRRWHISLSTWLRDYVFISMGGSRGSLARTAFTLMTTFALCGLWHGAKWTFVAFGLVHGGMMVAHRLFQEVCKRAPGLKTFMESGVGTAAAMVTTFFCVTMGWVFFRAQDFHTMGEIFHGLFLPQRGMMVRDPVGPWSLVVTLALLAVCHAAAGSGWWRKKAPALGPVVWGFAYTTVLILICMLGGESGKAFIYFQF